MMREGGRRKRKGIRGEAEEGNEDWEGKERGLREKGSTKGREGREENGPKEEMEERGK